MRGMITGCLVMAACGGSYDLEPLSRESYASLDTPVMAGGETVARPVFYSDVTELLIATGVRVSPPDLAEVSLDGDGRYVVIRPPAPSAAPGPGPSTLTPGHGTLHVTLDSGAVFERAFSVAAVASTTILPQRVPVAAFPARRLPGERLAVFEGEELLLTAHHRDVDGSPVLGHAADTWTGDNVQLVELDEDNSSVDRALLRLVRPIGPGPAQVRLGTATLPLDVVPARTTVRLELVRDYDDSATPLTELRIVAGHYVRVIVLAYAEDGRFIYGGPPYIPLGVTSSDPGVIALDERQPARSDRAVAFRTDAVGAATLTFSFDGASLELPVVVY